MIAIPSFKIIGISVRTTNANNQAQIDINKLWDQWYNENIIKKNDIQ